MVRARRSAPRPGGGLLPRALGLLLAGVLSACLAPRSPSLLGRWVCVDPLTGGRQVLCFEEAGRAQWSFETGAGGVESYSLTYRVDRSRRPRHIDLDGFDRGPLAGMVLCGIYQFLDSGDLELDCEPTRRGLEEEARPVAFTSDALVYRRLD